VKGKTPEDWYAPAQADFEALSEKVYAFDILEYMELNYECSGVCNTGLFYFSRPASDGMPTETCAEKAAKEVQDHGKPLYTWLLITTIVGITVWIVQFLLWFKY